MLEILPNSSPFLSHFAHGFLGRQGGVSGGIFEGLNVGIGSSDDPAAVAENRARAVAAVMPGAALVTLHQVHSAEVVTVTAPFADGERPKADAMVTDQHDLLLGILTADCVPVLFGDAQAGVVGAAHAGWKGALGGVTDATLAAMEALGADRDRIVAATGPCIGRASYEVRDEFALNFAAHDSANERFFSGGKTGHQFFDIEAYVAHRLATAGIARIEAIGIDTVSNPDRFFSYRRATLNGEPDYGRQMSLIGRTHALKRFS
jgi:polyphenol oxidase